MVTVEKRILAYVIIFILCFFLTDLSYCDEQGKNSDSSYSREWGFLTGWGSGDLHGQDDYEALPLLLQIGFDAKPLFKKINIQPKGMINFIVEPLLSHIFSPNANIETGCNFLLKYRYPFTKNFNAFVEFGLGLLYTTQHTKEQATQFNFSEQGGVGFGYFFCKNKTINFSYRFRHFSNADIKRPNAGIEMDYFLCGISVFY